MAHILATCSRILYDRQILEDRNELEALKKEKDRVQDQLRRLKMKYKYLELRHRMRRMEDFTRDLWVNDEDIQEKAFHVLCGLCGCEYEFIEDIRFNSSFQKVNRYPYDSCCNSECHLVLEFDIMNCPHIHFGKKWWDAKDIKQQLPVYLLFYTIEQVYTYTNGWFDEGTFYWVIDNFLMPYKNKEKKLLQDAESFEAYFMESETFRLEYMLE